MRIAICDDNKSDALRLEEFLDGHAINRFYSAEALLEAVNEEHHSFDLYFLDIYIENSLNGIELAKQLRSVNDSAVICFISSSDEFYREAYDLYDVNYLLKPVKEEEVKILIDRVSRTIKRNREQFISFKRYGQMGVIYYDNILYISSDAHTLCIYCKDGSVKEYQGKLAELAQQLDPRVFFRCHQSFLVNMYEVDNLSGTSLKIGDKTIPVSRRYYAQFKARYHEVLFEEVN